MDTETERHWHVTCRTFRPRAEDKQFTVWAVDEAAALAEARAILGEDRLDSVWTVRPATDRLPYNTSYVDYLFNNGKRHAR